MANPPPPNLSRRRNHCSPKITSPFSTIAAMDLFVVPTIGLPLLVPNLRHRPTGPQRPGRTTSTANPTAEWIARQITQASPGSQHPPHPAIGTASTEPWSRRLRATAIDKPIAQLRPDTVRRADRIDPSRECQPCHRLGRGTLTSDSCNTRRATIMN